MRPNENTPQLCEALSCGYSKGSTIGLEIFKRFNHSLLFEKTQRISLFEKTQRIPFSIFEKFHHLKVTKMIT